MKYVLEFGADERIEALQAATAVEAWGALSDISRALLDFEKNGGSVDALLREVRARIPAMLDEVWR